ncbi:MAG: HAMP domain-containing sensor histidine kinase [bacterium]
MKKILVIVLIFLSSKITLLSDENYPNSYELYDIIEGGKLIVAGDKKNSSKCFFIKPSWSGETESISIWDGIKDKNIKGITLNDVKIYSSYSKNGFLLIIWEENKKFYISLLDSDANILSVAEIYNFKKNFNANRILWIESGNKKEILLLMNDNLYICKLNNKQINLNYVAAKVKAATGFSKKSKFRFAYISDLGTWTEVYFAGSDGKEKMSSRIQLSSDIMVYPVAERLAIISTNKYANSSWLHFVDSEKGIVRKKLVNANGKLINIFSRNNEIFMSYLSYGKRAYSFNLYKIENNNPVLLQNIELPMELIEAKKMYQNGDIIYSLFRNGLSTYSLRDGLLSIDYYPFGEYFEDAPGIMKLQNHIILSSVSTTLIFTQRQNELWWFNRFLSSTGKIILPTFLFLLTVIIYRKYRRHKRLLSAIIELPSSGVVFVLDKRARLISANDSGKKMLRITDNVPLRRIFQYYCDPERTKALKELIDKAMNLREAFTQKIDIIEEYAVKEWYFSSVLLTGWTGKFKGCVLTGFDITEQLERKRLTNWAQLAHDMQTNLSTIRLNAEQLECPENEINLSRRQKILHQVGLLIHRIRDIVTVGRSSDPELQYINASDICLAARSEFDETMFPYVKFELNLKEYNITCDKAKLIRALRNVIENGIRALKENEGTIIISNWSDNKYFYFSVKDTGVGMDENQIRNMLTPYFSTSQKEGGAGIGTMIIQNVVEQHGGTLKIESEPGKGTEVIISIPVVNI